MIIPDFSISILPRIELGPGAITRLPKLAAGFGIQVLLVTGAASFKQSPYYAPLLEQFAQHGLSWQLHIVNGEPSPQDIDAATAKFRSAEIDVVVAIGGGSVLDAAKAIAGLLRIPNSVMDFLEGVGPELDYPGPSVPFIAVPTTAGTGSEATKNAVLSVQGPQGFKKSFRHETLVPQYALIDPNLMVSCPKPQIAANGMDALTQLLESYVSMKANPFTDALALSGIEAVREGLLEWYKEGPNAAEGRAKMAYAALLSGISLAQVGLGSVHGLAAPLGAFFPIPHGVVCGTLVAACTETNIAVLLGRHPESPALARYAAVGRLLGNDSGLDDDASRTRLVSILADWTWQLGLPRLSHYGMKEEDIARVVANCRGSSMKTNPVVLTDEEISLILKFRL